MDIATGILAFIFGITLGSFCNVLIARLPVNEGIGGRSRCPHCHHQLAPVDLIPIISWIILNRACRYCKCSISGRYPLVESIMGLAAVLIVTYIDGIAASLCLFGYFTIALVVMLSDWEHAIIPNETVVAGIILAASASVFGLIPQAPPILLALIAGFIGSLVFILLHLLSRGQGLGMGDVKLVFMIGLALGPFGLLVAIMVGSITGVLFAAIVMIAAGRQVRELADAPDEDDDDSRIDRKWGMMMINGRPALPFGTFLMLGFLLMLFWGEHILVLWLGR